MDTLEEIFASLEQPTEATVTTASAIPLTADGCFATAKQAFDFLMGGNATATLVSKKTEARFTFKVAAPKDRDTGKVDLNSDFRFVSVLNGPDNWQNYAYFGYIRRGVFFHGGAKAKVKADAASAKAFAWAWANLARDVMPPTLEVWHEGKCGRCGRKLTVPQSIATGFGPECSGRM